MPSLWESFGKFLVAVDDCLKKKRQRAFLHKVKWEGVWQQMPKLPHTYVVSSVGDMDASQTDTFKLEVYS